MNALPSIIYIWYIAQNKKPFINNEYMNIRRYVHMYKYK